MGIRAFLDALWRALSTSWEPFEAFAMWEQRGPASGFAEPVATRARLTVLTGGKGPAASTGDASETEG